MGLRKTQKIIVSVGPTLSIQDKANYPGFVYVPPISSGDIFEYLDIGPSAIAIIDGFFGDRLAVQHKEVLCALGLGVPVFGAASMGAIRAAELDSYGLVGIGSIYEDYKSGVLTKDEDVAVVHAPEEFGFKALSISLVDLEATLRKLVNEQKIDTASSRRIANAAQCLHFSDRTWSKIASASCSEEEDAEFLRELLRSNWVERKRCDAIKMLDILSKKNYLVAPIPQAMPPGTCYLLTTIGRQQSSETAKKVTAILAEAAAADHMVPPKHT